MVRKSLTLSPVVILYVVNAVVAMIIALGVHLSTDQAGAIDTIVTGILTLIAAFAVRPVDRAVVAGAAVTVLTAFSAFGLHLSADVITSTVTVASILMAFLLHQVVTPLPAAAQGKTADQLMLEARRVDPAPPRPAAERFPG